MKKANSTRSLSQTSTRTRTTLPSIFVDGNHAEIALVENLQRQDLTSVEEAEEKVCAALIAVKDKIDIFLNPNSGVA